MSNKVLKFNKANIKHLPINSLYWDYRSSEDAIIIKTVKSSFYNTTDRAISKFYKSVSPISL